MRKLLLLLLPLSILTFQSCTKDFGSVEVTYTKATAVYGDLDDVRNTALLEDAKPIENAGKIFVAENLLLIGEEGKGIHIVDNTNPESPNNLSFINIPGNREYFVAGNTLYAESYYDMVKIDVSNKNQPVLESRVKDAFKGDQNFENANGESLIGFDFELVTEKVGEDSEIYQQLWGHQDVYYYDYADRIIPPSQVPTSFAGNSSASVGSVNRIAVVDEFIYVISRSFLTTFEDKGNLEKIGTSLPVFSNMETVFPNGNQLLVGTAQSMEVFDISNNSAPRWVSSFPHANSCDPVLPCGNIAFVTLRTGDVGNCPGDENALLVLDISKTQPQQIQEIEMESPFGMMMANNRLYVGEGTNGLKIFNAEDKSNLTLESWEPNIEAYDIIYHPTNPNLLLIAGPTGISQYQIEGGVDYSLISTLTF